MRLGLLLNRHAVDACVVLLAALWQVENAIEGRGVTAVAAALLGTLPLLFRRRFPFAAPVVVFAGVAGTSLADLETAAAGEVLTQFSLFSLALAFWFAGAHNRGEQAVAGTAIGCASVAAAGRSGGKEFVVMGAGPEIGSVNARSERA
jgi:hypothetical protein